MIERFPRHGDPPADLISGRRGRKIDLGVDVVMAACSLACSIIGAGVDRRSEASPTAFRDAMNHLAGSH